MIVAAGSVLKLTRVSVAVKSSQPSELQQASHCTTCVRTTLASLGIRLSYALDWASKQRARYCSMARRVDLLVIAGSCVVESAVSVARCPCQLSSSRKCNN